MVGGVFLGKNIDKKYVAFGVVLTVSLCTCILFSHIIDSWGAITALMGRIWKALTPFTIGLVLAFLLNPIMVYLRKIMYKFATKKLGKKESDELYNKTKYPALIITMLLFLGVVVGFLWLIIPKIYESLTDLVNNTPEYVEKAKLWVEKMFSKNKTLEGQFTNAINYAEDNIYNIVRDRIMPNLDTIVLNISSGVVVGVKAILNFFLGLIVTVYLLASKEELLAQCKKIIYCLFPKKTGNKILEGCSYANLVFGGFINGKIIDSIIIGILCFIFTAAVGMKYAVLISVIVGVTNIIPFFGPFIGAIPGSLLAVMDDPIYLLIFVCWIIVLQQFDGNILGPLILGDSTGLSGIWVLLAIMIGGNLFGVAGMILGVPVFACIYAFIAVNLRDSLRRKHLSSNTADYIGLKGFDEETGKPEYRDRHEKRRTLKTVKRDNKLQAKKMIAIKNAEANKESENKNTENKEKESKTSKVDNKKSEENKTTSKTDK